ncbi:MAG TPA: alpha/beta hydrolase [Nitrososphaeraceae archaeon]|nr:alpha/beta hydrolase [Nitrososphaeraceae archaeon]
MDKKIRQLGFIHRFIPSDRKEPKSRTSFATILLLHGTGGNEEDLISLGHEIAPGAALLSPRGKVLENGLPRFFRRLSEGVFDIEDLKFRTNELADFVEEASKVYGFDLQRLVAIGYSNGANIAASGLLLRPDFLSYAILFRPMVPLIPEVLPNLGSKHILISAGLHDPIVPSQDTKNLLNLLKKAGAETSINWQNSGHELSLEEIKKAKDWLFSVILPK